jgi:predicted nucleotidyltransferase/DNA-binding XRE family transcriptional regulator
MLNGVGVGVGVDRREPQDCSKRISDGLAGLQPIYPDVPGWGEQSLPKHCTALATPVRCRQAYTTSRTTASSPDHRPLSSDNGFCYRKSVTGDYGHFVRARRAVLGLSQRDLAARAGVQQPLIAAIEAGRRRPSAASRAALDRTLAIRPSLALEARRSEVLALFARAGLAEPRVFGSVARGEDRESSDVDLLVEFTEKHDIADLLALEDELEELLTVDVDIVDARASGRVTNDARAEAVKL